MYEGTGLRISYGDVAEGRDCVIVKSWCSGGGSAMTYLSSAVAPKTS